MKRLLQQIGYTCLLLILALGLQYLQLPRAGQIILAGSIIGVLIVAASLIHSVSGFVLAAAIPLLANALGVFDFPEFMVRFVIAANLSLVLLYSLLERESRLFAMVMGVLARFGVLQYTSVVLLRRVGLAPGYPEAAMLGTTQLAIGFIGGFLAFIVIDSIEPLRNRR